MKVEFSDISRLLKSMVKPATNKPCLEEPEAWNPQNPDSVQDTGGAQPANYSDGAQSPGMPSGLSAGQNLDTFPSAMSVTSETHTLTTQILTL